MKGKTITRKVYKLLREDYPLVNWKTTMYQNMARPRAVSFSEENINHLFFVCTELKLIWQKVLRWLKIDHVPMDWTAELRWITRHSKGKGWKAQLLKSAAAETVYALWKYRNDVCFGNK
ncbi:hypothetical protein A2U01_0046451, partial [Trifolium medium]|nr:hypothetical protein [Trifolium medium]